MPDFDDVEQEAKDHGNLMDVGVAEVEKEAEELASGPGQRPVDTSEDAEKEVDGQPGK
jgi:hypothetical protein